MLSRIACGPGCVLRPGRPGTRIWSCGGPGQPKDQAAAPGNGQWVAEEADPERSFAALVTAAAASEGSGWLEWEPRFGADSIRTEPVIALTAHRHFPVGEDEPWVHASIGGGRFLAIPLRFVVSYRQIPKFANDGSRC